nr:MAG TPA: hypothetical protein [Caudoviricetes sp.]
MFSCSHISKTSSNIVAAPLHCFIIEYLFDS